MRKGGAEAEVGCNREAGTVYWGHTLEWFEGQAVANVSGIKGPTK